MSSLDPPAGRGSSRRSFLARAALLAAAAATPAGLLAQAGAARRHKMILDFDIGIDDAFAVLLAHYSPAIDLLGITTVFGNADIDQGTRNALYLKQKFDIPAQVYRGAAAPLHHPAPQPPAFVHGADGLGDVEEAIAPTVTEASLSAPEYLARTIAAHPGEIAVVAVGPATNLLLAQLIRRTRVASLKGWSPDLARRWGRGFGPWLRCRPLSSRGVYP